MKKTTVFLIFLFWGLVVFPQTFSNDFYYGKNKVIRRTFDWKYIETPHFRIYHYVKNADLLNRIAEEAEKSYSRLSLFFGATIAEKTPIIFYNNQTEIEQTNLYPGLIPPGSFEGFTEPIGHRVVIYGNRSGDDLARLLMHELTHSFENEILYKGARASLLNFQSPPLWIMEGLAEFMTDYWDSFMLLTVRDAVLNDRIPEIQENGDIMAMYGTNRTPYDFGHLMCEFLYEKFGKKGLRTLLQSQRRSSLVGKRRVFLEQFNYTPKTFNYEFKKFARQRFQPFVTKENPEDYSYLIGPDFPFFYSFSHQLSPSGELLAVLTVSMRTYKLEIVLLSLKDGKVIKNITPGFTSQYDEIGYNFNPSEGRTFSWDGQGERIVFFARKELDNFLVLLDMLSGEIIQKIKIRDIQKPTSPVFHPRGGLIYFTGVEDIHSYIYALDLQTQQVRKLTAGKLYVKAIDLSADGNKIVYSARSGLYDKLYLAAIENPDLARQLTDGACNDITPVFSADQKTVFYSSDELGAFNVNSIDLENHLIYRYTDVRTANFFPIEVPKVKNQLVISSFHKGSFYLFKKDTSRFLAKTEMKIRDLGSYETPTVTAPLSQTPPKFEDTEKEFQAFLADAKSSKLNFVEKKYRPFDKVMVESLPPITLGYGTNGDFFGSTYLTLTDVMADHNLFLMASSIYGYRSYHVAYINQKRRLQYFTHLYYETDPYYFNIDPTLGYQYSSYITLRRRTGGDAGVYYPFNRSYRAEFYLTLFNQREDSDLFFYGVELPYGQFFNGWGGALGLAMVGETTRFAGYGPNMGHTFRFEFRKYLKLSSKWLDAYTLEGDVRKYFRIDNNTLLALRLNGFYSGGANPLLNWSGGNNTIRSTYFYGLAGNKGFVFNAEFRFPLIQAALTPLGVLGPFRGVLFFDMGQYWFTGQDFHFFEKGKTFTKLQDGLGSYGYGVEFFLWGIPLHLEYVRSLNPDSYLSIPTNDSTLGKRYRVNFWIGYDF